MRTRLFLLGAIALTPIHAGQAQVSDSLKAAVHRVYGTRTFRSQVFGPARWIDGGAAYTTVEPAAPGGKGGLDIVRYETVTGARSVLVPAWQMVPEGQTDPLDYDDYQWSADHAKVMLFTNTKKVWRQNTRGDYWVLTLASHKLQKLGGSNAPASSLMYAKFSPDGSRAAYVRQGDIYVERFADQAVTQLTSGSSATLVNGMSDWVYEEEFNLRDAFRWSPDGSKIAFWQFDMSNVNTFNLINDTDSLYPYVIPIQYPKAGTTNSAVKLGVVSIAGGTPPTWLRVPGDPHENYLPWMEWVGPQQIVLQHFNRKQNQDEVMLANAGDGSIKIVITEKDSAWVDLVDDVTWLESGARFLWPSERDGWRHIYSISKDGKEAKLVTPGAFDVAAVSAVDEKGGWLYYTASPTNATQRYLFRGKLDGTGEAQRLSPAGQAGWHGYTIAPGAQWAWHTYSTFDTPPVTELIKLPSHEVVRTLVENVALKAAVRPYVTRPVEFFQVPVSGSVKLDGWMIRPANFDSTKTYPILMFVYGEPAGQTVTDRWGAAQMMWHRALADQGYIVASVDNQGTPAPRGRAWRKVVYRAIGVLSSRQQADAVQVLSRTRHYVDSTRVAIWGWSGGGSSTLQAMFRYPDVYQVGMSVAPVPDERLYDTIYQERYMSTPQDNAEGYRTASAVGQAEGLKGRLLLVHGSGDDNVHYQGSERLVNRMINLGKTFDFMTYPNRSHCICEGQGTTEHIYQLLTRYLTEHLPAGGR
jgi:dipeptidyl-peptidase-4